jgi:hypothetical protein
MKYLTMIALAIAVLSLGACAHKEDSTYRSTSGTATTSYGK